MSLRARLPIPLTVALLATVVAAAPAAQAAAGDWSVDAYYNRSLVASGNGHSNIDRATYAANRIKVIDRKNDGNTVYGQSRFDWYQACPGTGTVGWCQDTTYTTQETTSSTETWHRRALRADADRVRITSRVCAQLSWPVPDACSNSAITTLSY